MSDYLNFNNPTDRDLQPMVTETPSCHFCCGEATIKVGAKHVCRYCFTFGDADEEILDLFFQGEFNELLLSAPTTKHYNERIVLSLTENN